MVKQFIRLSALRKQAQREVEEHVARWDDKQRVLNAILGGGATNREWLEEARQQYARALAVNGFERIGWLARALLSLYKCHYRMQHSRFNDESVHTLREKAETAYLNAALNFIEDHIHDDDAVEKNLDLLQQAITLLDEENSRLARAYRERIRQYQTLGDVNERLRQVIKPPATDYDAPRALQVRNLLHLHAQMLKADTAVWDALLDTLRSKVEEIYSLYRERLEAEQSKPEPSLHAMSEILDAFAAVYAPLREYAWSKRYQVFLDEKDRWREALDFLQSDYPALKRMYDKLSLPRDNPDIRAILELYEKLAGMRHLAGVPWREFRALKPGLEAIAARYETVLEAHHRRDMVDELQAYNRMLNAPEGPARVRELGRFLRHLQDRLADDRLGSYVRERLQHMQTDVRQDVETGRTRLLEAGLAEAGTEQETIEVFDGVIALCLEMEDVDAASHLQRLKRERLERLRTGEPEAEHIPAEPCAMPQRLVILDNYSLRNYVVYTASRVSLGRDDDNAIILQSEYVSGHHAVLDFVRRLLIDLDSTNGTTVNGTATRVGETPLDGITRFDLAGGMVFTLQRQDGSVQFRLQSIQDRALLDDPDRRAYNQSLLNTTFVWLAEGESMSIHKISGGVNEPAGHQEDQLLLTRRDGCLLLTDAEHGLRAQPIEQVAGGAADRFSFSLP